MSNIKDSILELLTYQKEAYNKVIELFEEKGKAAVVFPTGCGKSFISLEYMLKHPDERILFLSPRNAIKDQMYELVIRYLGGDSRTVEEIQKDYGMENNTSAALRMAAKEYIPNIECMLYQTISGYGEKDSVDGVLEQLKPDVIIVDEMHHLKTKSIKEAGRSNVAIDDESDEIVDDEEEIANVEEQEQQNKWGEKFHKFLEDNPQAKLLGLSATPLRTDGANVVERIFEDSVASEISLSKAIEQGIIYPPKYVVPDFIREDELETLLQKIEQAEGLKKEILKEKYDDLVKKSTNAPGIPELMQEHIEEKDGKYIIYCKDINDMQGKMEKAKEWFGKIDEEPEVYGIHSKDKTSAKQLEQFKTSNSEHLKLMYCVGMIDEGVHLSDISGVILSAKTGSRPTYLQRIGRGISSGKDKKQVLVIDLVNNNEILNYSKVQHGYEINDLELLQELVEWVENNDGELPEFDEEKSVEERTLAKRLARINNKYLKYAENDELIENLTEYKIDQVSQIIELGKTIGMFNEPIELELDDKERQNEFLLNQFMENIEIKGIRKEFIEVLAQLNDTSVYLENAKKIENWCRKNFGDKEKWERRLPSSKSQDEEESRLGSARRNIKRGIIDQYEGKQLYEINDDVHRKVVGIMRKTESLYAYGDRQKHQLLGNALRIKKWCEDNFGDKEKWERRLPNSQSEDEEEKHYGDMLNNLKKKFSYQSDSKEQNEIDSRDKERILKILKKLDEEYAYGQQQKFQMLGNALQIEKWCEENFGDKEKWERRLPSSQSEDNEEITLSSLLNSLNSNILTKYKGKEPDEIEDEVHRNVVAIIRKLEDEYAFGKVQKHYKLGKILEMENWCETNNKGKEKWERRLPQSETKDEKERELGKILVNYGQKLLEQYDGKKLDEIVDEEDRKTVEVLRKIEEQYAYGRGQKHYKLGQILKVEKWCKENFEDKEKWERRVPNSKSEDENESRLGISYIKFGQKLLEQYEGKKLDEIADEEDRKIVEVSQRIEEQYAYGKRQKYYKLGQVMEIEEWCKRYLINNGKIRLPRKDAIDDDEGRLGMALGVIRKSLQAKYQGKELEEIEDVNDRKVFEVIMRLDKEYNPRKAKKDALSQAKNERDNAKYLNKETVDLEQQVEAQLNERGKNHEE